jgi:hypothetical protein
MEPRGSLLCKLNPAIGLSPELSQSTPQLHNFTTYSSKVNVIIVLPSTLRSSKSFTLLRILYQSFVCVFHLPKRILCFCQLTFLYVITVTIIVKQFKLWSSTSRIFHLSVISCSLGPFFAAFINSVTSQPFKGKVVPVLWLSTTPWKRIGEWSYSSTHSWSQQ